jgi:hypothetical protein
MSVMPRAISANQALPLSDDQLRRVTPSLFAEAAHESRSDKYAYIPTV